jgi:predicted RNase H-like HicB family nuclease
MSVQSIKRNRNKLEANLEVAFYKEGKYFVAYCPAVEVSSYASTIEKAKERFGEELKIFFDETVKRGTLEKLLIQYGWVLQRKEFKPPTKTNALTRKYGDYPYFNLLHTKIEIPRPVSA